MEPIIPPELANDVFKAVDEQIISDICRQATSITPEEYREMVWASEREKNPTVSIRVEDGE